jgi:hypothetical protein
MTPVQPPSDTFADIPPFPNTVPTAPLLRISLAKLLRGDAEEEDQLWKACCDLGFFYLDLRTADSESTGRNGNGRDFEAGIGTGRVKVDGEGLLADAERLFKVGEEFFELPVEEKREYDFAQKGSYFGYVQCFLAYVNYGPDLLNIAYRYKGYGSGIIDKSGAKDRNEFYNVRSTFTSEIWKMIFTNHITGIQRRHPIYF